MRKTKFVLYILIVDIILSNIILKHTSFWNVPSWDNKYWRVQSKIYHHDVLPNINEVENWGGKIEKKIITNSIGFFDKENRKVNKINNNKKRILLIGDSFIEGAGLNYEFTFSGLLDNHLGINYEVLNSAVGSYSPSIYYKKTKYYLDKGYKFDQALIFLDVSDIYDELFIKFDENENIVVNPKKKRNIFKKTFYFIGRLLRDNSIIFRLAAIISDRSEQIKNYLKLKYKASKELNKDFLRVTKDEAMFYRMTHVDRGYWTFNNKKFKEVEKGINQSDKYLKKLFKLLDKNNIRSTLIVYPWPTQIVYGDSYHQPYWKNFALKNKINFLSLYDQFKSENNTQLIFKNFIYGDIHWNKSGTNLVFKTIVNKLKF